jgi:uncharacterized membrane protein YhaH (DUF805 family)
MPRLKDMTAHDWWIFMVSPHGRIGRFDYNVKFWLVVFGISMIAFAVDYSYLGEAIFVPHAKAYASIFVNLIFLWPTIAVSVKRLHDLNYRGWWLLPAYVLPIAIAIGASVYFMLNGNILAIGLVLTLLVAILLTLLLILCCARGTIGSNRFGHDPKAIVVEESVVS